MSTELQRRLSELWRLGWRRHLQYTVWTFVSLLVLLAMGPSLQLYVTSLVANRAPSIYDMAYDNGITNFPGFWDWLIGGIAWTTVMQAIVVTGAIVLAENRRGAFSYVIVAAFLTLFGTDLLIAYVDGQVDLGGSFVCDIVGSILLGGLVVVGLCAVTATQRTSAMVAPLREVAAPGVIVAGALACSALTYLIVYFLYQPLEDRFELTVRAPASGAMIVRGQTGDADVPERFSVTDSEQGAIVEIRNVSEGNRRSRFSWKAKPEHSADLHISALDGCISPDLKAFAPDLIFKDVRSMALWSNDGESFWDLPRANVRNLSMATNDELAFFWLARNKTDQSMDLSFFGRRSDIAGTTLPGFRAYLTSVGFDGRDKLLSLFKRRFTLVVNGRPITMTSRGRAGTAREDSLSCRRAGLRKEGDASRYVFDRGAGAVPGIALTLAADGTDELGDFSVRRIKGQYTFSGLDSAAWADRELGSASTISVGGQISDGRVADADFRMSSVDRIQGTGDVNARSIKDGFIINGKMHTLWKNQQRLLQTRWERLGTEIQVWVLGIFAVLFSWVMLKGLPLLRSISYDEKTPWST